MAALVAGHIFYGTVHHVNHHININMPPGKLLKRSRANHRIHHKMPDTNYGVTTTSWDRVFGTLYQSKRTHAFSNASLRKHGARVSCLRLRGAAIARRATLT
jgi:sterol desaturase/sphingolipid hydroxylase (fatty acid hydroxylase superfamily)